MKTPTYVAVLLLYDGNVADYAAEAKRIDGKIPVLNVLADPGWYEGWTESAKAWLKKNAPHSDVVAFGLHLMHWEFPDRFNAAVDAFLARNKYGSDSGRATDEGNNRITTDPRAHKDFVDKHPVATKRALRAIVKADQVCALEPERVARVIVERGFTKSYDYALQAMKEVPYGRWRQYEIEDAVRFYALRLHEAGVIRSDPKKIIADGTNWRFLNELKKELKG